MRAEERAREIRLVTVPQEGVAMQVVDFVDGRRDRAPVPNNVSKVTPASARAGVRVCTFLRFSAVKLFEIVIEIAITVVVPVELHVVRASQPRLDERFAIVRRSTNSPWIEEKSARSANSRIAAMSALRAIVARRGRGAPAGARRSRA